MEVKESFEELLCNYTKSYKKGDLVTGTVYSSDSSGFSVDIGDKSAAHLPLREVDGEIKKGDELQLLIMDFDERDEFFILSQKRVHQAYSWQELEKLKQADEVILGDVAAIVKGGLIVEILGIRGFVPSSQILLKGKEFSVGDKIELKILTLEPEKENFILSNKKVHSDLDIDAKKNVFAQIEVGQVLKGCVVRMTNFGAFVDIGGVDGLLPLSQMSWKWVEHSEDVLSLGDKIDVEVIAIDKEKNRVSLSLKSLEEDPWISAKDKLHENDIIEGVITRIKSFGAFVEVLPGVEALLAQKDLEEQNDEPQLTVGEHIKVKILKINPEDRRISLSLV